MPIRELCDCDDCRDIRRREAERATPIPTSPIPPPLNTFDVDLTWPDAIPTPTSGVSNHRVDEACYCGACERARILYSSPGRTTPQPRTHNTASVPSAPMNSYSLSQTPQMKPLDCKIGMINKFSRPIGTELEMSSCKALKKASPGGNKSSGDWWWTEDSTITSGGKELVINPAAGDDWIRRMGKLIDLIAAYRPMCDESCGYHVHIQSNGISWHGLRRLITIWCRIEQEVFDGFCDPDRQKSRWCIKNFAPETKRDQWQFGPKDLSDMWKNSRTKRVGSLKRFIVKHLYGFDIGLQMPVLSEREKKLNVDGENDRVYFENGWEDIRNHPDQAARYRLIGAIKQFNKIKKEKRGDGGHRYGALNLHSHFHRGTIEFRLKEGTVDAEELIFWPLLCGWIVESAARFDDKTVLSIKNLRDWLGHTARFMQPQVHAWVRGKIK